MQRNLAYQSFIKYLFFGVAFFFYTSLGTIYLFLPPMMGVVYFLFSRSLHKRRALEFFWSILAILLIEAQYGLYAFSFLAYAVVIYRFIEPKIDQSINKRSARNFLLIVSIYVGYPLFWNLMAQIFMLEGVSFYYFIPYYIFVEFFVVSLFL